jgi:hypothetical protein
MLAKAVAALAERSTARLAPKAVTEQQIQATHPQIANAMHSKTSNRRNKWELNIALTKADPQNAFVLA